MHLHIEPGVFGGSPGRSEAYVATLSKGLKTHSCYPLRYVNCSVLKGEELKKKNREHEKSRDQDKVVERQNLTNLVAIKDVSTIICYVERLYSKKVTEEYSPFQLCNR